MPVVAPGDLRGYLARIFEATGAPADDAAEVAAHLVEANLKGHDSHGAIRTVHYVVSVQEGRTRPAAAIEVERETETTAVVNGNWNFGQVVAREAMAIAVRKARAQGLAAVGGRQSAHIGRAGAYGEQAAAEGMVALGWVNGHGASAFVAPFGGTARRLATNPLFVAAPTGDPEAPFVLDMATPVVAEGKVRVARNRGAELAPGLIVDGDGAPSTDPLDLYGGDPPGSRPVGALLPLGVAAGYGGGGDAGAGHGGAGHKGYVLGLAVDLLAGALTGAGASSGGPSRGNGFFFIAVDPQRFAGLDPFEGELAGLLDYVRQPPYAEGFDEILTPGEPERRRMAERSAGLALDAATWRQIGEAAASVGVGPYDGAIRAGG